MRILGIFSKAKKYNNKPKEIKKYANDNPVVKNMLAIADSNNCDWTTSRPLEKISMDETYVKLNNGKNAYLSLIIDEHTKVIIGHHLSETKLVWSQVSFSSDLIPYI